MAVKKHTHKYQKIEEVWCCTLPDCTHFMPKNVRGGSVEGKSSICHDCGDKFTLTLPLMKINSPRCYTCARMLSGHASIQVTDEQLEEYLKGDQT